MKKLLLLISVVFAGNLAFSQDSNTILKELSEKAKTFNSIYAEYESTMVDKQNGINESQSGKIKIKDQNYNLELGDFLIITNGEDFWNYNKSNNECILDYYEDVAEDMFDPSKLFTIWEQDYKHEYKGTSAIQGIDAYQINLYPLSSNDSPYHTVKLFINKAKMEIMKIEMSSTDGSLVTYKVTNFTPNTNMNDSDFIFQTKNHPGVEMIDNRI